MAIPSFIKLMPSYITDNGNISRISLHVKPHNKGVTLWKRQHGHALKNIRNYKELLDKNIAFGKLFGQI